MVLTLPPTLLRRALEDFTDQPWVWLWKLTANRSTSSTEVFQLAKYPEPITWNGSVWSPFQLEVDGIRQTVEGDLITVGLGVSNATREIAYFCEKAQGFRGMPATAWVVNLGDLASGAAIRLDFTVQTAALDRESAAFTLTTPNFFNRLAPQDRITRDSCRRIYKGKGCGYRGLLPTCTQRLSDCIAHGDDELQAGLTAIHPERFGAFPGSPRRLSR